MEDIMSGGMKITDHKSWVGPAEKGEVFPKGAKVKMESSAEGAGELSMYGDTTEAIKAQQVTGVGKAKANSMKPGYRN